MMMEKLALLSISILITAFAAKGQISSPAKDKTMVPDSVHAMLRPDSNTTYLDEAGTKLDPKEFAARVAGGQFSFTPTVAGGKLVSLRLKKASGAIAAGSLAPDFTVNDIEGKKINLKSLQGKLIVVNFWFTNCAPCLKEIPELNDLAEKYKADPQVVFLAITYNPGAVVKAFLKKTPFKYDIVADQSELVKAYGITGYPTNLVIDKTGHIAFTLTAYSETNVQQLGSVIKALKSR